MKTVELTIGKLTYFTKSGTNKKLNEKKNYNINLTHLYRMVSVSVLWTLNGCNKIKKPFWINLSLGNKYLFDCGYRVVGILLLLLAMPELIPD